MLSRIAESLFWIGRYVERADDTARLLDAFVHRALEDPWADEDSACRTLLAILGVDPEKVGGPLDSMVAMRLLAFDDSNPTSIAGALAHARDNARGARETLSSELWECLNVTWQQLPHQRREAERLGPYTYLRFVRERCAMLSGLADATLSRDDGWRFLVLGRSLERADMTARLLTVRLQSGEGAPEWSTLLTACGAHESFLRTHGASIEPARVAEFLLLDRQFPRSVVHALQAAEDRLMELAAARERSGTAEEGLRAIGGVRTTLEYADTTTLLEELPGHVHRVEAACGVASQAIAKRYFTYSAPMAWEHEEG
jgi:uncharacterized alpha-E superfamily protein